MFVLAYLCFSIAVQAAGLVPDSIICKISGTLVDRPDSKFAILLEEGKDYRTSPSISIPIIEGKFSYTLKDDMPRVYALTFDDEYTSGRLKVRNFFTGNGSVELTCGKNDNNKFGPFKSDIHDNILYLNIEETLDDKYIGQIYTIKDKISQLLEDETAYTQEVRTLLKKMEGAESDEEKAQLKDQLSQYRKGPKGKMFSPQYLELEEKFHEIVWSRDSLKRQLISDTPSLVGLHYIKSAIQSNNDSWEDIPGYIELFERMYKDNMKEHPYSQEIAEMIEAREVKVGNKYPDYKVTREDGSTEQISALIKGNAAVMDLWASWCSPCRKHSIELIPLYEKYKDKGFKVVAIAREQDDCKDMNKAIAKDGYPWESFVDIGDKDKVWRINNAGNSGGKIILIDEDGIIVGTDIPTKEIEEFLIKTYGE